MRRMQISRAVLFATTVIAGAQAFASASAQTAATAAPTSAPAAATSSPGGSTPAASAASNQVSEVIVTGTLLRRKLADTAAPLTVVTSADLDLRGITTVTDAIQQVAANGSSNLPNSFTANGAFAAGASAASLRGLTTNSTLTLIDGLRTAYYPLADDGTRNFVDLNSIPEIITDRVEILKDGASSTYGADAIAGVINVITKKTYQGITVKAEGGATQAGGGGENNYQALIGQGDLGRDGYNVYLGVEYEHDDALYNRQRGYPYNTADLSQSCGISLADGSRTCRGNAITNGIQADGSFQGVLANTTAVVRPFIGTTPQGDYQLLSPAGCGPLKTISVSPAQAAAGGATGITAPVTLCQQDLVHDYYEISPDDKRFSLSFRATKEFANGAQAYLTATYYQNDVSSISLPSSIRQQSTPGALGLVYSSAGTPGITLPVYVCAAGVNCGAGNGVLNPNNPFASLGEVASIRYRFGDIPASNEQFSQTYRVATGTSGSFNLLGDWNYSVDATAAQTDLRNTARGDIYIANLLTAVATGAYNFVDPSQNTKAVRQFISPDNNQFSTSKLFMVQGSLTKELFQMIGGPLQLAVNGSARYESIYNPSANTDANGATNRYFTINPFGTIGSRDAEAIGFELDAPVFKQLDLDVSGRYDTYSTGQDNFSPKVGARFTPIHYVTFRTTYSQGFRIPSFAESNSLPTTGFVTANAPTSFQDMHGGDKYGLGYSLGETTQGTAGLKPERSSNFTAGFVLDPIRQLSFSLDFYQIKKRDLITPNTSHLSDAITAYYNGTALPAGYKAIAGIPDPNFPNLQPTLGFISYGFTNLGEETTSGYDIGATARFTLPYGVRFTSHFDGNYVLRLDLNPENGSPIQHYAGTIGPYNNVSASGTPKFRANWQNAFTYGPATVAMTAYFTDGYQLEAADFGDTPGLCIQNGASASSINATYQDGVTPVLCKVKAFWDIDAHGTYEVTKHVQLFLDIQNLFDKRAPYDPTTYGATNYNPAWANAGIYGRSFKVGAKAVF